MYLIVKKDIIAPKEVRMLIKAPYIAKNAKAGQFIILRIDDRGERIPLTIADSIKEEGLIDIVFQEVGKTTAQLALLNEGEYIKDVVGPLGQPSEIIKSDKEVIFVGGGVGIAAIHPIAKAFKEAGNYVVSIIGARSKDMLIMEEDMKKASHELLIATDDGSYGYKGFVTDVLRNRIEEKKPENIALIYGIGPTIMMKFVAKTTQPYKIKTIVSLNSIMVDGTGMCGACRVTVGGKTKFACVDGPEFDGHLVDFDELINRNTRFKKQEKIAYDLFKEKCKLEKEIEKIRRN